MLRVRNSFTLFALLMPASHSRIQKNQPNTRGCISLVFNRYLVNVCSRQTSSHLKTYVAVLGCTVNLNFLSLLLPSQSVNLIVSSQFSIP